MDSWADCFLKRRWESCRPSHEWDLSATLKSRNSDPHVSRAAARCCSRRSAGRRPVCFWPISRMITSFSMRGLDGGAHRVAEKNEHNYEWLVQYPRKRPPRPPAVVSAMGPGFHTAWAPPSEHTDIGVVFLKCYPSSKTGRAASGLEERR